MCEVCIRGENLDDLLICDDCDRSFHTYCLGLDSIPSGATWYCPECCERHRAGRLTSGLYAPARSRTRQALRFGRGTRTVGAVRRLQQQTHYDTLRREDRAWRNAWQHLDSDLEFLNDDNVASVSLAEEQLRSQRSRQAARMMRRREVAAAQTDGGPNAFDQQLAWMTPTSRPRTFPHSQQPISEEERSAWRMFDIAEGIEKSPRKRSRRSSRELTRSPVSEIEKPSRKRPRTRRDSQLLDKNGESLNSALVAPGTEDPGNAGSTASGSYLGSILESIAKSAETTLPDPPPTGLWGIDLSKMRPLSPEPSNAASPRSRPISPVGTSPFSPTSPPRSRPHSPVQMGQISFPPSSPTRRTPIVSYIQSAPARPWELSLSSPPISRANSPIQQQQQRHHSYSLSDREEPGSDDNRGGASSSSDTDSRSNKKERHHRQWQQGEGSHSSITAQDKADIAEIVRSVLKPLYPEKLSKDDFTEINKSVSRKLYQLVEADKGYDVATEKEKWTKVAEEEVINAVECL